MQEPLPEKKDPPAENNPKEIPPIENPSEKRKEESPNKEKKQISNPKKGKPDFVLDGMRANSKLEQYNGLIDRHLATYFCNEKLRSHLYSMAISLKKPKITDAGHIVEGKKKKIRKVNNKDTSSERDKSQKIRHTNSLENQYIDKLPKLPNAQNDSHVVLPKIYLTNLKIEQQTERKTGPMPMPESKKINEHSFSNNKANDSNIYKKKTFHNKSKLQSLSKDELTKVFNKYRAKISCENTPSNELQSTPSRPVPELQTKPPPKIQEKSSFKEQSPKSKPPVKENLPNEKSPKAKPKETGGFSKKTSIDKSNEVVPLKKDEPKKSVSGTEGVMKQVSSQKNVENGENQKAKETEIKKEEVKEPEKGKIDESPIKENGNLELSPVKKEGSEEGKEYEEEIFEDPVEKN